LNACETVVFQELFNIEPSRTSPYAPPASDPAGGLALTDERLFLRGRRLGWAALVCSVFGVVGWHGLPLVSQLLAGLGWHRPEIQRMLQLAQAWTSPGTLVALVVGSIGLFRFQSQMAFVGLIVAFGTILLPTVVKFYTYLLSH